MVRFRRNKTYELDSQSNKRLRCQFYDEIESDATDGDTGSEEDEEEEDNNMMERMQQLEQEISQLQRIGDELQGLYEARILCMQQRDSMLSSTIEYYHVFRNGCLLAAPPITRFITERTDPETFMFGSTSNGRETLIEQWRRYTTLMPGILLQLHSHEWIPIHDENHEQDPTQTSCMVVAQGSVSGIFSYQAIATILPHILYNQSLVLKLVNQSLVAPVRLCFYFNTRGRVNRMDVELDFLDGFRTLENLSLNEVATIMEHAAIDENSMIREIVKI